MKNLKRFGVLLLWMIIACIIIDLCFLGYTYLNCSRTVKDTLSNIALVVAEENCISTDGNIEDSKYLQLKKMLVQNAPMWLTYNDSGPASGNFGTFAKKPTNIQHLDLDAAMDNVVWETGNVTGNKYSAIKLSRDGSDKNESSLYSYLTCPQRGEPITIHIHAYVTTRAYSFVSSFNYQVPIHEKITVVGMKFYRGR